MMNELEKYLQNPETYVERELSKYQERRLELQAYKKQAMKEAYAEYNRRMADLDGEWSEAIKKWVGWAKEHNLEVPAIGVFKDN